MYQHGICLCLGSSRAQVSKKSIYIAHRRETSNALNASVRCEQKRLKRLSETVPANNRVTQVVRQGIPDRQTSHTESPSAIGAELVTRYDQMDDNAEVTALPPEERKRPYCCPWITWMKTVLDDVKSHELTLTEAVYMAVNDYSPGLWLWVV